MTAMLVEVRVSQALLLNVVKGKMRRNSVRSDCQRYGIFNGIADNVDKYS